MTILLGAVSREMGLHKFQERDDLVVGILIKDEIENGGERKRSEEALLLALQMGFSPDDIHKLMG